MSAGSPAQGVTSYPQPKGSYRWHRWPIWVLSAAAEDGSKLALEYLHCAHRVETALEATESGNLALAASHLAVALRYEDAPGLLSPQCLSALSTLVSQLLAAGPVQSPSPQQDRAPDAELASAFLCCLLPLCCGTTTSDQPALTCPLVEGAAPLDERLEEHPRDGHLWWFKALQGVGLGDARGALAACMQGEGCPPSSRPPSSLLALHGDLLFDMGEWLAAADLYQQYLQVVEGHERPVAEACYRLAWIQVFHSCLSVRAQPWTHPASMPLASTLAYYARARQAQVSLPGFLCYSTPECAHQVAQVLAAEGLLQECGALTRSGHLLLMSLRSWLPNGEEARGEGRSGRTPRLSWPGGSSSDVSCWAAAGALGSWGAGASWGPWGQGLREGDGEGVSVCGSVSSRISRWTIILNRFCSNSDYDESSQAGGSRRSSCGCTDGSPDGHCNVSRAADEEVKALRERDLGMRKTQVASLSSQEGGRGLHNGLMGGLLTLASSLGATWRKRPQLQRQQQQQQATVVREVTQRRVYFSDEVEVRHQGQQARGVLRGVATA